MNQIEPSSIEPLQEAIHAGINLSGTIVSFIILFFLLVMSALASGSESAFFSLSPSDKDLLKNEDSKSAKTILHLLSIPQELLATILITNNFVNVGIVILSSSLLEVFYPIANANETIRFIIEVLGITFLLLLVGEVIPKIYGTKNSLPFARLTAGLLNFLRKLPPISWLKTFLVHGTKFIQRTAKRKGVKITTDELEMALELTKQESTSEEEHKILEGIVKFGNTDARQIMKSRMDIVALENDKNFQEVVEVILEAGYSRIPVYEEKIDNVIGILYIKDLLPFLTEKEDFDWMSLIRKPYFIPENKKIDDLLREFQSMKMHMAVVVDEYGGASGIVTLEDVLEEIVGDITDEFDDDEIAYTRVDDRTFLFEGRTALMDFYKVVDIDGKEFESQKGDAETLGGFMTEKEGRILKNNEYIVCDDIKLIAESSDKRRIKMIKAILPE
ncbi:MAG: gliding motility-associated protein GldE [Crocinitomicaceae bacterium]|jgi:putative hemolysin|nr:gliding motility-associated protein GldE [Crocinitomicaceae bacterium]MDP5010929.1 gliding motility-associated protein GldE [Crocinitomicaceae bacterium]